MAYQPHVNPQNPTTSPFPSTYLPETDNSTIPLELIYGLGAYPRYQGINLNAMMASNSGSVASPTTPPIDGTTRDGLDPHLINAIIQSDFKNVKRRTQNREAQRRFRERKDERQKTLEQKTDDLHSKYQTLSDQYAKSSNEVSQLLMENDRLQSEVKNLRQQWRLMLAILQRHQQGSQSPSDVQGDVGFFDDVRCCLEELIADPSSQSPHSQS